MAKPVRPVRQSPERARHWRNRREKVRNLACFRAGYRRGGRHPGCGTGRPLGHPGGTATADWQERQGAAWRLLPAGNRKSLDLQGKRSLLRHIPHPGDHQDPGIPGHSLLPAERVSAAGLLVARGRQRIRTPIRPEPGHGETLVGLQFAAGTAIFHRSPRYLLPSRHGRVPQRRVQGSARNVCFRAPDFLPPVCFRSASCRRPSCRA